MLALVGPTASGKSAIALEIAAQLDAEIVAVDAFTVYRGMDVGTAKPSLAERARVPHHCLDLLEPSQDCTVRWFQQVARESVAAILDRGRIPLLVGGSGLYFRAVVDPLEFPPTDPRVRALVEADVAGDAAAAHARLTALDPAAAAVIDPGNLRRSVRALEVITLTGRPFSDWRRAWDHYQSRYSGLLVVGVERVRAALVQRIDDRVAGMFAEGLVEECRALAAHALSPTARQAIGYAEVLDALAGSGDLASAAERVRVRTRRYAARQARWFRADPRVVWTTPSAISEVMRP